MSRSTVVQTSMMTPKSQAIAVKCGSLAAWRRKLRLAKSVATAAPRVPPPDAAVRAAGERAKPGERKVQTEDREVEEERAPHVEREWNRRTHRDRHAGEVDGAPAAVPPAALLREQRRRCP